MEGKPITAKPIDKLNFYRKISRLMPHHCSYCGKRYVKCYSSRLNIVLPTPRRGKFCPDGHEGYIIEHLGYATIKNLYDFVEEVHKHEY